MKKIFGLFIMLAVMSVMCTSCMFIRPYDKPEYVQIDTNETAFVIDLFAEGEENTQVTLTSEEYYEKHLLNEKVGTDSTQVGKDWSYAWYRKIYSKA